MSDKAHEKYPGRRVIQVAHSLGHQLAQHAGDKDDEFISHNGAVLPWNQRRPKTTMTRSRYDPVSLLAPGSAQTIQHSGPLDVLGNHGLQSLQRGDPNEWVGRR